MNDKRKHRNQMSTEEIACVEALVHSQSRWVVGKHAKGRMARKGITVTQVFETLGEGQVVEINRNNDLCALFRKDYGGHAVCVVVSLQTRWVVTMWKNAVWDTHSTLDKDNYCWDVDVQKELAAFA